MDLGLLRRAVELARVNGAEGQLPFGAVIANGDEVVATGVNTALRDNDPTAHGEVVAVRAACRELGTISLAGTTLYSSCEPCPICHTTAIAAEVDRVVYAAPKEWVPDLGTPFAPVLIDIQAAARRLDPDRIVQIELVEAREPFAVFLETRR
ncbi:nucleoside deaminase [Kribbella sp. NPDC050124]|uniref:nucleoside deaminase n=1 Tax=Kribbella sp. NPDC050124 TaxID=3364114 RepID=UPI00379C6B39